MAKLSTTQKFLQWVITSSNDPEKVSLTIRGVLLTWVAMIISTAQILQIPVSEGKLMDLAGQSAAIMGAILMVIGLVRKLIVTAKPKVPEQFGTENNPDLG